MIRYLRGTRNKNPILYFIQKSHLSTTEIMTVHPWFILGSKFDSVKIIKNPFLHLCIKMHLEHMI